MKLNWTPQLAFCDYFHTNPKDIIATRSVFRLDTEYFIAYGGRGSAKTWTFADAVVIEATLRPVKILVTRELQNSIDESIKTEIESAIYARGLEHFFDMQKKVIKGRNGSEFIFKGLRNNIKSIKSIANVDIVLAEEADTISKNSWDVFLPSIRPKEKHRKDPIIIVIFNPDSELDDTNQRFVVNPPDGCISKAINWRDNKHFPAHLERQRAMCLRTRPKRDYDKIWEGKPTGSDGEGIIDLEWVKAARFASRGVEHWPTDIGITVAYDPSGQGRDFNATVVNDNNRITFIDEWLKSPNLRQASERAVDTALDVRADIFRFDSCGGFGDGVEVFVDEYIEEYESLNSLVDVIDVQPFDAGAPVVDPDDLIDGTSKTQGQMYSNAKAQAHGVTAQKLYNAYRFVILSEDVDPCDMLSIDIEDDEEFKDLCRELCAPLWVRSGTNSKKKVESKADMEKRTGQPSPNKADGIHMTTAPIEQNSIADALEAAIGM